MTPDLNLETQFGVGKNSGQMVKCKVRLLTHDTRFDMYSYKSSHEVVETNIQFKTTRSGLIRATLLKRA